MIEKFFEQIYCNTAEEQDQWTQNFSWPISWPDFLKLEKKVIDFFYKLIDEEENPLIAKMFIIQFKEYIPFLNNLYLQQIAYQMGWNENEVEKYYKLPSRLHLHEKKGSALKRVAKNIFNHIRYNPYGGLYFKNKKIVSDVSAGTQTYSYIKKNRIPVRFRTFRYRKFLVEKYGKEFDKELSKKLTEIFSKLDQFFIQQSPTSKGLASYYYDELNLSFKEVYILYKDYLKLVPDNCILYLAANNSTWSRVLSAAIRKKGGKVHSFSHGEPLIYNWNKISWMELSMSDVYHEYTEKLADLLKKTTKKFPPPNNNQCQIKFQENPTFIKTWNQSKNESQNSTSIKKVMLIGNAYKHDSFSSVTAIPSILQFHLERQIISQLIKSGFEVIYQKHPGGLFNGKKIDFKINSQLLQVNDKPFEESMGFTDSFLFYYTRTTTFGPAICSSKPVLILDGGWEDLDPKLKEELGTRCQFVKNIAINNGVYHVKPFKRKEFNEASKLADNDLFFKTYLK